jgi:hypothetical protein
VTATDIQLQSSVCSFEAMRTSMWTVCKFHKMKLWFNEMVDGGTGSAPNVLRMVERPLAPGERVDRAPADGPLMDVAIGMMLIDAEIHLAQQDGG